MYRRQIRGEKNIPAEIVTAAGTAAMKGVNSVLKRAVRIVKYPPIPVFRTKADF